MDVGVHVRVYAWPSTTVLRAQHPGQIVPRKLLAAVTTNSHGVFAFRIAPAALAAAAVSGVYANLEADSYASSWFFTVNTADPAPPAPIRLSASPDICTGWVFKHKMKPSWGIVGQSYVLPGATRVSQDFIYTQGQSTTLGIGVSPSGKAGTFTASGSDSVTKTAVQGFPTWRRPTNVWDRTLFSVGFYTNVCGRGGKHPATGNTKITHMVRATGWFGGSQILHPRTAPPARNCAQEPAGSHFSTSNETAVTWSAGFTGQAGNAKRAAIAVSRAGNLRIGFSVICGLRRRQSNHWHVSESTSVRWVSGSMAGHGERQRAAWPGWCHPPSGLSGAPAAREDHADGEPARTSQRRLPIGRRRCRNATSAI